MDYSSQILILVILFVVGVLCLRNQMIIVQVIAVLPRFFFRKLMPNLEIDDKLKKALLLLDEDPNEYANEFHNQLSLISATGVIALIISIIGFCLIALSIMYSK